jgi:hypothetical protein
MGLAGFLSAATVEIRVVDQRNKSDVACRIHLADSTGKPVRPHGLPFWFDHFVCPGFARLELAEGTYRCAIERGPEYGRLAKKLVVGAMDQHIRFELVRIADLAAEGWWSGDMHVHRSLEDIEPLMRAEDLHIAPVITWWNNRNRWDSQPVPGNPLVRFDSNRFYYMLAGEDEREGGALLFFNLRRPVDIRTTDREFPSPMTYLSAAHAHPGAWVDIEKPFWWDVPIWLASGMVNSIGVANNHMCRDRMYETEAWGKPRDPQRLPAPLGNGYWSQELYYRVLESGCELPPSAGSASGVLPNPLGYNRVYVFLGDHSMDYEHWWMGLRRGQSFVTNGPLLRVRAAGTVPGHVFTADNGRTLEIPIRAKLTSQDPLRQLEVIKNGTVERSIAWDGSDREIDLGTIRFESSGWFLVRAITDVPTTFRFASTGPYYVRIGGQPRQSQSAARFFLDWARERAARVKTTDPHKRAAVLEHHRRAIEFWDQAAKQANVP